MGKKEKVENIKTLIAASLKYIVALETNDAEISDDTLDTLYKQLAETYETLEKNTVRDLAEQFEREKEKELNNNKQCKFVSLR